MPVIRSLLDNDLYKFTMQKAVLAYRPHVLVEYLFINRGKQRGFSESFAVAFADELQSMSKLRLSEEEFDWFRATLPWLGDDYFHFLASYRFDPSEIKFQIQDGQLHLSVTGPWERTILWEVPLLALISELYFTHCETNWQFDTEAQARQASRKAVLLADCPFSDFGTRRRRSFETQELVVRELSKAPGFRGTSNVYLAYGQGLNPVGTMAHEWIMGVSALESLRHANRYALRIWHQVYQGRLGIALTDTFGTKPFFDDFDTSLARLYDGVRQDSGDPWQFTEAMIGKYQDLGIDPRTKTIIYSDNLTAELARRIQQSFQNRIRVSFGIGTHFTNDFPGTPALNMVIKMSRCNGIPVVKLSDVPTKAIGQTDALRVANWTFFGTNLDNDRH